MTIDRIYLFGSFQLISAESEQESSLEIRSGKLQALLAYLILNSQKLLDRDKLGQLLWPEANNSAARRNLREYLYRARQLLAEFKPAVTMINTEENFVAFIPPPDCWIDVVEFERLSEEAHEIIASKEVSRKEAISLLQETIAIYRDNLLSNLYDDWIIPERERFRSLLINNLAALSHALQAANELSEAIAITQRLLEYDPLREEEHRHLMEIYYISGDRARALQQYQSCCQILADELGAEPMAETQALYQAILKGTHLPDTTSTLAKAHLQTAEPQTSLPFVNRQTELAQLTLAMTESQTGFGKMVIITGESGLGKTRLVNKWLATLPADTIILRGQGNEFEQDIPYRPLLDAFQQTLPSLPWNRLPPDSTYAWLRPLAQFLPDLYYYLPNLSASITQANSEIDHQIMEGMAQLILAFARQSSLVLFLDNLHWADESTWRTLSFLLRRIKNMPVFMVAIFASSEANQVQHNHLRTLEQNSQVNRLSLSPLSQTDLAQLASQLLNIPADQLTPLIEYLYQDTQGNPFLAIETLQALSESNTVPPYAPEHLDRLPLPAPIHAMWQHRLERLEPDSRQALAAAAALDRPFDFDLLAAINDVQEVDLLDFLDDWLERGLVVEQASGCYDFYHPRVRQVIYQGLSRPRRQRIHHRITEALAAIHPEAAEWIAYHDRLSGQSSPPWSRKN